MRTLALLLPLLAACDDDPCPRGSMLESAEGIVVTEAEHPTGWGKPVCAGCHAFDGLHLQACTPEFDLESVQEEVEEEGATSCVECHGSNGTP